MRPFQLVTDSYDPRDYDEDFQKALRHRLQAIERTIFLESQLGSNKLRAELPAYAPEVSRLLASYLETTAPDATFGLEVYGWLAAKVFNYLVQAELFDPGPGAVELVQELIEDGDSAKILATVKGLKAMFPNLEPGYHSHMDRFQSELMAECEIEIDSPDYCSISEAMMIVWLTLWAGDDEADDQSQDETQACPVVGEYRLVKGR